MALTLTTLNGAVAYDATQIKLTSATGLLKKDLILVDGEFMVATDIQLTPSIQVARGQQATQGVAHATLAPAVFGQPADFTFGLPAGQVPLVTSIAVNDTNVTLPTRDALVFLTKATALGITINAPAKDQQNTIKFISTTAAAHLITYTAGFYGNTTSSDVATFPATVNGTFTIQARGGTWAPVATADDGVTIG